MPEPTVSSYRISGVSLALLMLLLSSSTATAQQLRISGRVTAFGTGAPVSDVRVELRGSTIAARTDSAGRYTLTSPATTGVLVFSRLGFVRHEAPFNGQTTVDASLTPAAAVLGGIVVVGYGQKSRETLTESVGTISSEEIRQVPVASPEVAIQGRVSGIQVQSESGAPGAPVSIRVRGVGTVGNTQPLFVIDGLPVGRGADPMGSPLATINPEDIESISVLKDASAAAVYGVQAANGVVLIQTRRGRSREPSFEYTAYYGVQNLHKRFDMLNTEQWFALGQEAFDNYNEQFGYAPSSNEARKFTQWLLDRKPSLLARNTDWLDVVAADNAPISNQHISVSGLGDRTDYFLSAGFFQQDPIIEKWDFRRFSFRVNSNYRLTDRIRFGETFALSQAQTKRGQNNGFNGQLIPNALSLPPFFRYRDEGDSIAGNRYGYSGNAEFAANAGLTFGNEPAYNQLADNRDRDLRVLGGIHGEIDVLPALTFRSQGSLDVAITRNSGFQPNVSRAEIGLDRPDFLTEDRSDVYSLLWSNTLTYTAAFGPHNFNLLGGTEVQYSKVTGTSVGTTDLITTSPGFREVPTVGNSQLNPPGGFASERAFLGYLGRLSYNYGDKYLLTVSLRRDGSSNFAPENRWGTFPAVSAGWRISEEPFFNVPWISELKLRGSWGQLGNSDVPASFPHLFQVTTTPDYGLGGETVVRAPSPIGMVNRDLVWETSESIDFGFESGFFDNRLSLSATYFRRDTKDFLVNVPLPWTSGFSSGNVFENFAANAPVNSGKVRNKGFEFESGYNFTGPFGVDLSVSGNLTTLDNELVSLREGIEEYSSGSIYRTAVGHPIDYFYGYKTCGIYQTAEAAAAAVPDANIGNNEAQAGDVCFQDVDGDGEITADDRTFLGKSIPDYFYGLRLNATYRRFDVGVFFSGVGGVQKYNEVRRSIESVTGGSANRSVEVLKRWTPTRPSQSMPRAIVDDPNQNDRLSDRWIEDANFFRLRNLQVGYTLPDGSLRGLNRTRVYVAATNLFTVTPYNGLDPEFTTSVDYTRSRNDQQQQAGTDRGFIPQPRIFQLGVSTSF
jgi:TonB-dependent starch-binding outer membrane protein SusC